MRHGDKVNNLGRKSSHRKAMISNMACSLIRHKRINTTVAKAKALRVFVEPLLTKSKKDSTHSRRIVFSYLQDKEVVTELFRDIAPKIAERNGGYTRILKTGYRLGDNAEMCMIELVDYNELYSNDSTKKTTRRSRRGGVKKATDSVEEVVEATEINIVDESDSDIENVVEVEEAVVVEENMEVTSEDTSETDSAENPDTSAEEEKKD
jgi:large subunit ribosomal protein L17